MNRILVIAIALLITLITISSSLYAGPFGLFGRGRSSCANGSCSRSVTSVIVTDSTNSTTNIKGACCDCKCGCDLCKCATECCVNNAGKCNCACGCPNCTCANTDVAVIVPESNTKGANNNSCATCNSGSCGPNSSCSQNSQIIMRSRSKSTIIYGRKTPIRNILKKIFHR